MNVARPATVYAVVPAAGVGRRFGGERPKQYELLAGKTVLEHSVSRLQDCPQITGVWVALNSEDTHWSTLSQTFRGSVSTVLGGAERADSVRLAIEALPSAEPNDWVLVHDAVRPLISPQLVTQMLQSAETEQCGAILAMPLHDTVKRADSSGRIETTLDRSRLWAAQTPQIFRYGPLLDALKRTQGDTSITDEASAMEACGHAVQLLEGHRSNIKITCPEDLQLAELLMIKVATTPKNNQQLTDFEQ